MFPRNRFWNPFFKFRVPSRTGSFWNHTKSRVFKGSRICLKNRYQSLFNKKNVTPQSKISLVENPTRLRPYSNRNKLKGSNLNILTPQTSPNEICNLKLDYNIKLYCFPLRNETITS
jgi:hypothetical protein